MTKHLRLQQLVDVAGEAHRPPSDPEGGVPRQWLPGWVRWPLRLLFWPFIQIDLFSQKIARKIVKPPFKRVGSCKKRGNCCHVIMLKKSRLDPLFLFWQTQVNGFFHREEEPRQVGKESYYVMGCRYLTKEGRCARHRTRPLVCRKWPIIEHFGQPQILKGCGYKLINRTDKCQ